MTPYPTTSDQKTTGKQTGGAIHKPEAPPSHSRQEQVTSIKDGRTPNPCSPEPRQRGDGCQPKPWTWKHTAISIRTVRRRHRRARHPRTGMETASIQPSRDDDVAGPGVHLRFPLPIGSLTQHATAHAGTSTVHATPAGAPRVPLTPRRAPRQRAVVTNRKGKRR